MDITSFDIVNEIQSVHLYIFLYSLKHFQALRKAASFRPLTIFAS